jgi:hypothetical protein
MQSHLKNSSDVIGYFVIAKETNGHNDGKAGDIVNHGALRCASRFAASAAAMRLRCMAT